MPGRQQCDIYGQGAVVLFCLFTLFPLSSLDNVSKWHFEANTSSIPVCEEIMEHLGLIGPPALNTLSGDGSAGCLGCWNEHFLSSISMHRLPRCYSASDLNE